MPTLTDFATIKALLSLSKANLSDYSGLEEIMDSVDAAISDYMQREITSAERTVVVHINGASAMVALKGLPVSSVSSISTKLIGANATALTATEYQITEYGLRLSAPTENSQVDVTYTGGPSSAPGDWKRAAEIQVRHEWQTRDHIAAERVSTDGGSVQRPGLVLLDEVKRLLDVDRHPLLTVM